MLSCLYDSKNLMLPKEHLCILGVCKSIVYLVESGGIKYW